MRLAVPAAVHGFLRWAFCPLAVFFALSVLAAAQSPAGPHGPVSAQASGSSNKAAPNNTQADSAPAALRGAISLRGPWRFETGDDPRWAEPGFDDSSWQTVTLDEPLTAQGFEPYSGYAWYRMRVDAGELAAFGNASRAGLEVLVGGNSAGQMALYVNGVEVGATRGMTERPSEYESPPLAVQLSVPDATGARVLAIRTWADPSITIRRGLLEKVEIGTPAEIAGRLAEATGRQWDEHVISALALTLLFLCVAVLGAALYLAQSHHSEYLWLALLCLSVAASGAADTAFGLALVSLTAYRFLTLVFGRIFMAVTLEFVLRFTGSNARRTVRIVQIAVLAEAFLALTPLGIVHRVLSVAAEVVFCALICLLLYRAWRRGRGDAGAMLIPFFLAATADSVDSLLNFAAANQWLPERFDNYRLHVGPIAFGTGAFGTGTIAYAIFLASLVAVILYRFISVSQEEQRSNAEIAAARSVQALLIPTQLPSNRHFMLESAYLPVNGVGGDFFQVLPLADDSLLLVVGDVSGKGLQAAMSSCTLVGALRNELSHDPATVLGHLNHVLLGAVRSPGAVPEIDAAPCFATCLCARIYPDGTMTIANAGHLSPYRDGRELPLPPSLPLGVIADAEYEQTAFQLKRGDRLVFLSDGVVEAKDAHGELFGFERTQQVSNEPARYIAQTAKHFGQTDDITVVSLYVASRAAERAQATEPVRELRG
ncbi:MAG: SpoIIE family protein phosphatase [Terracidiphilus sp.]